MSTYSKEGLAALCAVLLAITTVATALRFYVRRTNQSTAFGLDDWAVVPSYLAFLGMCIVSFLGIAMGYFGRTHDEIRESGLQFGVEASLVVSLDILSTVSLGFARITALLFYRRLFCLPGRTTWFGRLIWAVLGVLGLWIVAFSIVPPLQCGDHIAVWHSSKSVRQHSCTIGRHFIPGFVTSDLVLEVVVIVLPIRKIFGLKTSLRRRLAVFFVFLTALVSLAGAIARLVITIKIHYHGVTDLSLANTNQAFYWVLEAGFSLIAINLPSLWVLRKQFTRRHSSVDTLPPQVEQRSSASSIREKLVNSASSFRTWHSRSSSSSSNVSQLSDANNDSSVDSVNAINNTTTTTATITTPTGISQQGKQIRSNSSSSNQSSGSGGIRSTAARSPGHLGVGGGSHTGGLGLGLGLGLGHGHFNLSHLSPARADREAMRLQLSLTPSNTGSHSECTSCSVSPADPGQVFPKGRIKVDYEISQRVDIV